MHSKLREDKPLERSVEQAVWITHRCKRGLWWIAGSGGRCCAFCLSCEEKKKTNANQMRNPSGVVFLFGKHASVQSDSVTVSNIEQSRESALMKRAHQSSHVTLKPASRAAVKTGTMASAPRWSGSSSVWNKPRSICSGHETNLSWSKRKKKKNEGWEQLGGQLHPPGLMEICQDPITLLSSAYNVWMTVPHNGNKAPRSHSVVKANVGAAFVVTHTHTII